MIAVYIGEFIGRVDTDGVEHHEWRVAVSSEANIEAIRAVETVKEAQARSYIVFEGSLNYYTRREAVQWADVLLKRSSEGLFGGYAGGLQDVSFDFEFDDDLTRERALEIVNSNES